MNKSTLLVFLSLFCIHSYAQKALELTPTNKSYLKQNGYVKCLTVENEERLKTLYPNRTNQNDFENWMTTKLKAIKTTRKEGRAINQVFNIPVVVHVIHSGDPIGTDENISDAQVESQIQVLNDDYRRMGTRGGANTTGVAVDTEINFCLAKVDPTGNATNGIDRQNLNISSVNSNTQAENIKTQTIWDPTKYLNMWVFKFGQDPNDSKWENTLGYAQFPSSSGLAGMPTNGGAANTDGVVARYNAFGSLDYNDGSFTLISQYGYGRTMTHEVGHWLGLRHIWGDAADSNLGCGVDDFCADTPNAKTANFSCNANNSCTDSPTDMIQNYMDYTNDTCMDTFTQDQKDRMIVVLTNSPRRQELNNSDTCTPLSVEEFKDNSFSLFPNPVKTELKITSKANNLPNGLEIYDISGRFIKAKKTSTIDDLNINVSNLSNGLYFIKIEQNGTYTALKFIKE